MIHTWYVLTNKTGTILGVYGSALENEARTKGAEIIKASNCEVALHVIVGNRPSVFATMSMRGSLEWL